MVHGNVHRSSHSMALLGLYWTMERFKIAFTANGKREIRVYGFLKKISTQISIVQDNSGL